MKNNLSKVEKDLRSIARRFKTVRYSIGLAVLFLMLGINAFSEETVTREIIQNSVGNLQSKIETLKIDITIISNVISYLQNYRREMRINDL